MRKISGVLEDEDVSLKEALGMWKWSLGMRSRKVGEDLKSNERFQ